MSTIVTVEQTTLEGKITKKETSKADSRIVETIIRALLIRSQAIAADFPFQKVEIKKMN